MILVGLFRLLKGLYSAVITMHPFFIFMKRIDLTGKRFGKLVIVSLNESKNSRLFWNCVCDCGNTKIVMGDNLRGENGTKSCGCISNTRNGITNGENKATYKAWKSMIFRCYNEKACSYHNYGGRGIKVCDRWLGENGFNNFLKDMGFKPFKNHSLDRYPNNETGWYEPSNCRWGTKYEQERNKRTNKWYEYNGKSMILLDWAKELNVPYMVIKKRSSKKGTNFSEQFQKLKMIGDKNRMKGLICENGIVFNKK